MKIVEKEKIQNYFGDSKKSDNAYTLLYKKNEDNYKKLLKLEANELIKKDVENLNEELKKERELIEYKENLIETNVYDLKDLINYDGKINLLKEDFNEEEKKVPVEVFLKNDIKKFINDIHEKFSHYKYEHLNIFVINLNHKSKLINYDFMAYSNLYKNLPLESELSKIFEKSYKYDLCVFDNKIKLIEKILPKIGVENTPIYINLQYDSKELKIRIRKNILLEELLLKFKNKTNKDIELENLLVRIEFNDIKLQEILEKKKLYEILYDDINLINKDEHYIEKKKLKKENIKKEIVEIKRDYNLMYVELIKFEEDSNKFSIKNYKLNLNQNIIEMKEQIYNEFKNDFKDIIQNYIIYKFDHHSLNKKKYLKEDIKLNNLKILNGHKIVFKHKNYFFEDEYFYYDIRLIEEDNISNNKKLEKIKLPMNLLIKDLFYKIKELINVDNNKFILLQTLNKLELPTKVITEYGKPLSKIKSCKIGINVLDEDLNIGINDTLIYIQKRDKINKTYGTYEKLKINNLKNNQKIDEKIINKIKNEIKNYLNIENDIILSKRNFEKIIYLKLEHELKKDLKKRNTINDGDVIGFSIIENKNDYNDNMETKEDNDLRMANYLEKQNNNEVYQNMYGNDDADFKINIDILL